MKNIIVQLEDDEVLIAIKRPEEYEDVDPELVVEDCVRDIITEYRVISIE